MLINLPTYTQSLARCKTSPPFRHDAQANGEPGGVNSFCTLFSSDGENEKLLLGYFYGDIWFNVFKHSEKVNAPAFIRRQWHITEFASVRQSNVTIFR